MDYALELKATNELSHWELSHMINVLGNTYMKLTMLYEMQNLYDDGATDSDFIIGSKSLDLRINISELNTLIQLPSDFEYTILERKSEDADSFWDIFNSLHRPIILYKTNDGYKSLYNFENYIIFKDISTNSPQSLKTIGKKASIVIGVLVFETIAGHYLEDFIFEDNNQPVIERQDRLIEQNDDILRNQQLILRNQRFQSNQIDLANQETKVLIKNMKNYTPDTNIEYYDFLKEEKELLEEKLKHQLEKTPLNIEGIFRV